VGADLRDRPLKDDLSTVGAGTWAYLDNLVCMKDVIELVLYLDHGVAPVAQSSQRVEQPTVVFWV
jgi:hypothetical protein